MRTVSLGNTGAEVSVFCLGTMYFGSRTDKETSYRLLDQYVEAGGSFLDTANNYSMQKQQKPTPSRSTEKIGPRFLMLPPHLAHNTNSCTSAPSSTIQSSTTLNFIFAFLSIHFLR
jgi:hypothetical protein